MENPRIIAANGTRIIAAGLFGVVAGVVGLASGGSGLWAMVEAGNLPRHPLLAFLTPLYPWIIFVSVRVLIRVRTKQYRLALSAQRLTVYALLERDDRRRNRRRSESRDQTKR
jgi:hypothetical protein